MSKKLLSEAQVRRFAKLANLSPINEMDYGRDEKMQEAVEDEEGKVEEGYGMHKQDDEKVMEEEDPMADVAMDAEEEAAPEMDADIEDEAGGDLDAREAMAVDVIAAVADALNIEVDIDGAEGEELEEPEMDMAPEEPEMDMEAEDEIMEALKGINYIPERKEIVNEVAKRVALRLLKAKKAEKQLKEALGKK